MCLWEMTTVCVSAVPWPWLGTSLPFFSQTPPLCPPSLLFGKRSSTSAEFSVGLGRVTPNTCLGTALDQAACIENAVVGPARSRESKKPQAYLERWVSFSFPFSAFSDKSPAIFVKSLSSLVISSLLHRSTYLINKSINGFLKLLSLTLEV